MVPKSQSGPIDMGPKYQTRSMDPSGGLQIECSIFYKGYQQSRQREYVESENKEKFHKTQNRRNRVTSTQPEVSLHFPLCKKISAVGMTDEIVDTGETKLSDTGAYLCANKLIPCNICVYEYPLHRRY